MVGGCARRAIDRPNPPSRYAGSPAVFFPNVGFQIGVATQASLHVGVDDSRMDSQHAHMRRSELELAGLNQGEAIQLQDIMRRAHQRPFPSDAGGQRPIWSGISPSVASLP